MPYRQFEAEVLGQPHCVMIPDAVIGAVYGHEYSSRGH